MCTQNIYSVHIRMDETRHDEETVGEHSAFRLLNHTIALEGTLQRNISLYFTDDKCMANLQGD